MNLPTVVRNSTMYHISATLFRWFKSSKTETVLSNPLVLQGLLAIMVVLSIGKIMLSGMNAAVKFLSFAVLFVGLAFLMWGLAKPLADS